jgi:dihydroflavonol-4-reductase
VVPLDTVRHVAHTLVTGATGLVGSGVVRALLARGDAVRALVRDSDRARSLLPADVDLVEGDVTDPDSLVRACSDVELVFHAAGLPEQFRRDPRDFTRVNVDGTRHLLAAARAAGVRRVVHTSTMDVFAAPQGGTLVETRPDPEPKPTDYERSKVAAEREVDRALDTGLDVVVVNPAAVFGRAPVVTGLNEFFVRAVANKLPMVPPGGMSVVHVDGLAAAHVAAADRGRTGERYLVADGYATNRDLAGYVADHAGTRVPRTAPPWLLGTVARTTTPLARLLGFRPLLTPGELGFLMWQARVDTTKAQTELGFVPTPVAEGVARTVTWLTHHRSV